MGREQRCNEATSFIHALIRALMECIRSWPTLTCHLINETTLCHRSPFSRLKSCLSPLSIPLGQLQLDSWQTESMNNGGVASLVAGTNIRSNGNNNSNNIVAPFNGVLIARVSCLSFGHVATQLMREIFRLCMSGCVCACV